jgi:hypothetical protein
MPNLNGTGPQGQGSMTGGKRGRCRNLQTQNTQAEKQTDETREVIGVGRGGRPRGGGQGKCYGGNKRKEQGRISGN